MPGTSRIYGDICNLVGVNNLSFQGTQRSSGWLINAALEANSGGLQLVSILKRLKDFDADFMDEKSTGEDTWFLRSRGLDVVAKSCRIRCQIMSLESRVSPTVRIPVGKMKVLASMFRHIYNTVDI